jgi:hypothetical protein
MVRKDADVRTEAGFFVEHGAGCVWFYPAIFAEDNPYRGPESEVLKSYRMFLTDTAAALCRHRGLNKVAAEYFPDPGQKGAFLFAADRSSGIAAGLHHFPGLLPEDGNVCFREPASFTHSAEFEMPGANNLWQSGSGTILSHANPAVISRLQTETAK